MMSGGGESSNLAAGGPAPHIPVLLAEVLEHLAPAQGGLYLDATFGAGGYTTAILEAGRTRVLALDRDPSAIEAGAARAARQGGLLTLAKARFGELESAVATSLSQGEKFDGIVFDIGVSSMQFDQAQRGFSFRFDGPLDMRMESEGRSAADILNEASDEEIANIIFRFGEERASRRIARAIVHDRESKPFTSTRQLAELIARLLPSKPNEIHPATRTFQALRIAVNDELGELVRGLEAAERVLAPGGRLVVVTFHSLEDRIVKQFFAERSGRGSASSRLLPGEIAPPAPTFELLTRHPVTPGDAELAHNPRSRSAKLRAARRNTNPAVGATAELKSLAAIPADRQRRR